MNMSIWLDHECPFQGVVFYSEGVKYHWRFSGWRKWYRKCAFQKDENEQSMDYGLRGYRQNR